MAYLTALLNRARTPKQILADWDTFEARKQAEAEAAKRGTHAKLVHFERDVRESQKRIELAVAEGRTPDQADVDYREPNYPAMVAQYAVEAIKEHRSAAKGGHGDLQGHVDAIAAWRFVAQYARTGKPDRAKLGKMVAIAEQRSEKLVLDARKARKSARRAA